MGIYKGGYIMKRYTKTIVISAVIAAIAGLAVTGCGQARPEGPGTGTEKPTEAPVTAVTEAAIVIQTEAPETEPETIAPVETEAPTETPQTQPETQPETTPPTERVLTVDDELAEQSDYTDWVTMYANADINIRQTPTTNEDNIVSSYDKGEEAVIIGETPGWFRIYKEYDSVTEASELTGYVKKEYISSTYEDAMSDNPQGSAPRETAPQVAEPVAQETPETAAPTPETTAPASTAAGPTVTVHTDANIRADAYETASVVGVVNAGTTVTQIGSVDGWVQIDYNGVQGYVKAGFVG